MRNEPPPPFALKTPHQLCSRSPRPQPRPNKICGQACEHNPKTNRTIERLFINHAKRNHAACQDKEASRERMAREAKEVTATLRTFSKDEHAHRRQGKE